MTGDEAAQFRKVYEFSSDDWAAYLALPCSRDIQGHECRKASNDPVHVRSSHAYTHPWQGPADVLDDLRHNWAQRLSDAALKSIGREPQPIPWMDARTVATSGDSTPAPQARPAPHEPI